VNNDDLQALARRVYQAALGVGEKPVHAERLTRNALVIRGVVDLAWAARSEHTAQNQERSQG
jgi:hypothetical protein